jgi:hypothetical protein
MAVNKSGYLPPLKQLISLAQKAGTYSPDLSVRGPEQLSPQGAVVSLHGFQG